MVLNLVAVCGQVQFIPPGITVSVPGSSWRLPDSACSHGAAYCPEGGRCGGLWWGVGAGWLHPVRPPLSVWKGLCVSPAISLPDIGLSRSARFRGQEADRGKCVWACFSIFVRTSLRFISHYIKMFGSLRVPFSCKWKVKLMSRKMHLCSVQHNVCNNI